MWLSVKALASVSSTCLPIFVLGSAASKKKKSLANIIYQYLKQNVSDGYVWYIPGTQIEEKDHEFESHLVNETLSQIK